jgi:hypothetical protein
MSPAPHPRNRQRPRPLQLPADIAFKSGEGRPPRGRAPEAQDARSKPGQYPRASNTNARPRGSYDTRAVDHI